jgi:IMP cyclohydrolase
MVLPTDEELLKTGDPELLLYPAIVMGPGITVVSNGRQTSSIRPAPGADMGPAELLARALEGWEYEPDAPNFTPRISGCILSPDRAALSIIRRGEDGGSEKNYFEFPLLPGRAKMISTYSGKNVNPLPSFQGEPLDLTLREGTARETAEAVYEALGPVDPPDDDDFRVAAACVYLHDLEAGTFEEAVVNRHERKKP